MTSDSVRIFRSLVNATYFINTQTVALTIFGILTGLLMRFIHRYKVSAILFYGRSGANCHHLSMLL